MEVIRIWIRRVQDKQESGIICRSLASSTDHKEGETSGNTKLGQRWRKGIFPKLALDIFSETGRSHRSLWLWQVHQGKDSALGWV